MTLTYAESKNLLTSQSRFHINLGLERIKSVLSLFGNPHEKIKIIHIAGTNGKGSVSSILASILKYSGYKTGLYTSPHLVEYTERIKINDEEISQQNFAAYIERILEISEKNNINLTEFEILTVIAFLYFNDKNIDIAVMETGLGGRYDAVNVCDKPLLSVITSISLDHTDKLGDSIEKIAYEKAGIIKSYCPVVISESNNGYNAIKQDADNKKAPLLICNQEAEIIYENQINYALINNKKYEFPLLGLYQKKNLALVIKSLEFLNQNGYTISCENIKNGLKNVHWKARLEYIKEKEILIDGAHNPDGAIELKKSLDFYFKNKKRTFIYSTINTKDYKTISKILFNPNDEIYYYEFDYPTAVSFEEYTQNVKELKNITKLNIKEINKIIKKDNLKIITGSLYMIGNIYQFI